MSSSSSSGYEYYSESADTELQEGLIRERLRLHVKRMDMLRRVKTAKQIQFEEEWREGGGEKKAGGGYSLTRVLLDSFFVRALVLVAKALLFLGVAPLIFVFLLLGAPGSYYLLTKYRPQLAFPFVEKRPFWSSHSVLIHVVYVFLSLVPASALISVILLLATDVSVSKSEALGPIIMYLAMAVAAGVTKSLVLKFVEEKEIRRSIEERAVERDMHNDSASVIGSDDSYTYDSVGSASAGNLDSKEKLKWWVSAAHKDALIEEMFLTIRTQIGSPSLSKTTLILALISSFVLAVGHTFVGVIFRALSSQNRGFYGAPRGQDPEIQDYVVWWSWAYSSTFVGTFFLTGAQICSASLWKHVKLINAVFDSAVPEKKTQTGLVYTDEDREKTPLSLDLSKLQFFEVWNKLRTYYTSAFGSNVLVEGVLPSTTLIALGAATLMTLTMLWRLVIRTRELDELAVFSVVDSIVFFAYLISITGAGIIISEHADKENSLFRRVILGLRRALGTRENRIRALRAKSEELSSVDLPKGKTARKSALRKRRKVKKEIEMVEWEVSDMGVVHSSLRSFSDQNDVAAPFSVLGVPLTSSLRNKLFGLAGSGVSAGLARLLGWA